MSSQIAMACPKCSIMHWQGEHITWNDKRVSPPDIQCSCGLVSRWVVPVVRTTESGWILRPKKDSEELRACPTK